MNITVSRICEQKTFLPDGKALDLMFATQRRTAIGVWLDVHQAYGSPPASVLCARSGVMLLHPPEHIACHSGI